MSMLRLSHNARKSCVVAVMADESGEIQLVQW